MSDEKAGYITVRIRRDTYDALRGQRLRLANMLDADTYVGPPTTESFPSLDRTILWLLWFENRIREPGVYMDAPTHNHGRRKGKAVSGD
jgi:hypothetical protein